MGEKTYTIKTPALFAALNFSQMQIVRICGVAPATAADAKDPRRADRITLDTALKMYNGLREHGYDVAWEDVVEFQENGKH